MRTWPRAGRALTRDNEERTILNDGIWNRKERVVNMGDSEDIRGMEKKEEEAKLDISSGGFGMVVRQSV